eukprot:g24386.t1
MTAFETMGFRQKPCDSQAIFLSKRVKALAGSRIEIPAPGPPNLDREEPECVEDVWVAPEGDRETGCEPFEAFEGTSRKVGLLQKVKTSKATRKGTGKQQAKACYDQVKPNQGG